MDSISAYAAADNGKAAEEQLDLFGDAFEMLVQNPHAGCPRPNLGYNLRSFTVASYIIFYVPQSWGIDIVRVVHSRQDIGPADMT